VASTQLILNLGSSPWADTAPVPQRPPSKSRITCHVPGAQWTTYASHQPEGDGIRGDWRHAEVLICLPPGWPLDAESFKDERNYWPIRLLKSTARFPHEYDTWLGWGHTVPNGNPPQPYAPGVPFSSVLLEFPLSFPQEFFSLEMSPEKKVRFFALIPLHDDELRLKMTKGAEALEELFDAKGVSDVVDPKRPSVARRKWLGVF
jgi:hypothetical protein